MKLLNYIVLLLVFLAINSCIVAQSGKDSNFFEKPRFGIFVHYLYQLQNENPEWNEGKKSTWDECVKDFDVVKFASQLVELKADYVIFSLQQKTKYFCAPNETFEKLTGLKRGQATSRRDLINDLSIELTKRRIKLFLYVAADGPYGDESLRNKFGYGFSTGGTLKINDSFINKWCSVIKEFSDNYKTKISGWWVDGCDPSKGFDNTIFAQFEKALKSGNPNAQVAFNYSYDKSPYIDSAIGDYSAGEEYNLTFLPSKDSVMAHNKHWHVASFVGKSWTSSGIRFTDGYISKYLKKCFKEKGSVTLGVAMNRSGAIERNQLGQLIRITDSRKR